MTHFRITTRDKRSRARLGLIETPHGLIHTPNFVPVATKAALRGLSLAAAQSYGAEIFMMNTFHLFCNDQYRIIGKLGGLHRFAGTSVPIMTDSGGFQILSLGFGREFKAGKTVSSAQLQRLEALDEERKTIGHTKAGKNLVKISEDGVSFTSPYDGQRLYLTPERSMEIQKILGADICFAFDQCTSPLHSRAYLKEAMDRTHRWAERSLAAFIKPKTRGSKFPTSGQMLFGIIQGGEHRELRLASARFIAALPFAGFGIGGSFGNAFGDSKRNMHRVLDWVIPELPEDKPRHLLGIGEIDDLFEGVARGVDLFDCVIPTRFARYGTALTSQGKLNLRSPQYRRDPKPLDPSCHCTTCQQHSRAYICHLMREKELAGVMLMTEHNLAWVLDLMSRIRSSIQGNTFAKLKARTLRHYRLN